MDHVPEQLRTAVDALDKASATLFDQIKLETDEDVARLMAAKASYVEMRFMLGNLVGDDYAEIHPTLGPLKRAVEDVLKHIGDEIDVSIPETVSEEQLEEILVAREAAKHWLTQASVSGACTLAHMSNALKQIRSEHTPE